MATIKRHKLLSEFKRKGFETEEGGPHIDIYFAYKGRRSPFKTFVSRGSHGKIIEDYLIGRMAAQLHITVEQFLGIYKCDYDGDDYFRFVKESLGPDPLDIL